MRLSSYPDFTYHGQPAARREIERDGLITCGDIGYFDAEGYLFICYRKRDMVISGGANIYPAEIESVLVTMPGLHDAVVFGIPDEEFGEALMALVEPMPGSILEPEAVKAFCAAISPTIRCRAGWRCATRCRARTQARSSSANCGRLIGQRPNGWFDGTG